MGAEHTCALTVAGLVRCWGHNDYGATDVPSDLGAVAQVSAGAGHTCALTVAGLVRCWGYNVNGESDVPSDLGAVAQVSAGAVHTCALTVAGLVRCWGYNGDGAADVPSDLSAVTEISSGGDHSCALSSIGVLRCWGTSANGITDVPLDFLVTQVSTGYNDSCALTGAGLVRCWGFNPTGNTEVPEDLGVVTEVSASGAHTCALTLAGLVRCWGSNSNGESEVPSDLGVVTEVSARGGHTCALTLAGLVRCWGANGYGQSEVPSDLGVVTEVSAGEKYSCVLTVAGLVRCWGYNYSGQADVPGDLGVVIQVSAGWNHSCALTVAGLVRCWGYNRSGQTDVPRDLGVVTQVSVGAEHTCALTVAGLVRCWGANGAGATSVPSDLANVSQVSTGGGHTCAVTFAQLLQCWGYNYSGQTHVPSTGYGTTRIVFKQPTVFEVVPMEVRMVGSLTPGSTVIAEFDSQAAEIVYYQWYRNGSKIIGASQATYTVVGEDRGALLSVELRSTSNHRIAFGVASKFVAYPHLDISQPTIIGAKSVGSLLTAAVENSDSEVSYSYQWIRNGEAIAGATARQYSVSLLDLGQDLSVQVTGYKERYTASARTSGVSRISNDIPNSPCAGTIDSISSWIGTSSQPLISGSPTFGQTFKGSNGTWASGTKFCVFWIADGVLVPKVATSTLKLDGTSVGKNIQFVVVGIDKNSKRAVRVSNPLIVTKAIFTNSKSPVVKGVAKVGSKLTSSVTSWGTGIIYRYQWLRGSDEILGATASSYAPTDSDVGSNVSLKVCGSKQYFEQLCVESVPQIVSLGVISKVGQISIRGSSTNVGATLIGNTTQWMTGVELSWQWLADGVEIESATASTYTIARSDRGKTISLRVTGYADGYQSVSKVANYKKIP